jgi:hypothetical protein
VQVKFLHQVQLTCFLLGLDGKRHWAQQQDCEEGLGKRGGTGLRFHLHTGGGGSQQLVAYITLWRISHSTCDMPHYCHCLSTDSLFHLHPH